MLKFRKHLFFLVKIWLRCSYEQKGFKVYNFIHILWVSSVVVYSVEWLTYTVEALVSSLEVFSSSLLETFDCSFSAMLDELNIFFSDWHILSFDSILNDKSKLFPVFWSIFQVFFYYKSKVLNLSFRLIKFLDLLLRSRSWR